MKKQEQKLIEFLIIFGKQESELFTDTADLLEYISLNSHTEKREHEFKAGRPWEDLKLKIVKSALALVNLAGGGYVIIGVSENRTPNVFEATGMSEHDKNTFNKDIVSTFVNEFADPHIDIDLKPFSNDTKHFVVIQVFEFEEVPVICKKDSSETIKSRIYCRTHRRVESSPQPSVSELREIIELAIDKGIRKQRRRVESYGLEVDNDPFEQERSGF